MQDSSQFSIKCRELCIWGVERKWFDDSGEFVIDAMSFFKGVPEGLTQLDTKSLHISSH